MNQRFNYIETTLEGLYTIEKKPIEDERGFFSRFFCAEEFKAIGFTQPIDQINHTLSKAKGTVRGMHYQHPPHAEIKMVSCLKGEVFDVAVDLRKGSPTFLQWYAEVLSAENKKSLLIPKGFAHGFQTLTDDCELIYLHSCHYVKEAEGALNSSDHKLNITWPISITELSEKDRAHPMINNDFEGLDI
jgi:dTDP-4-dehydrorhamnose 3,5-epimerase